MYITILFVNVINIILEIDILHTFYVTLRLKQPSFVNVILEEYYLFIIYNILHYEIEKHTIFDRKADFETYTIYIIIIFVHILNTFGYVCLIAELTTQLQILQLLLSNRQIILTSTPKTRISL